jgi:sterol desaturase/sphingolipid hydroxylase (fatty acid hydroxylase superfamily)
MTAIDILGLLTPVTFFAMLAIEAIWPARQYPTIKGWRFVGIGFLVVMATIGTLAPLLMPVEWLAEHRLLDMSKLGVAGGAIVGFLIFELVVYGYHRAAHKFGFMWRWLHQMHHSARRLDMGGATVFHPLELITQNVLAVVVSTLVLGLDPLASAIIGFALSFYSFFQHLNVRTPQWLGYLIQRPEAHGVHHQTNVHGYNYADFPLWDMLFGTFKNPATFEGDVGFGQPVSYAKMLLGRDVSGGLGDGVDARAQTGAQPATA